MDIRFAVIIIPNDAAEGKSRMARAIKTLPSDPTSAVRASCVSWMPLRLVWVETPLNRMMKAVQVQMISVSVNTPNA